MRTFGAFRSKGELVYGEVRGEDVHLLTKPYWLGLEFTDAVAPLRDLQIDVPVAPSKLMAVGLNYADHIAEMKRTPLGTPLIWFKAPTSLLPHGGTIEDRKSTRLNSSHQIISYAVFCMKKNNLN